MKTLTKFSLFFLLFLCSNVFALPASLTFTEDCERINTEISNSLLLGDCEESLVLLDAEDTNPPVINGCVWMSISSINLGMASIAMNIDFAAPNINRPQNIVFSYGEGSYAATWVLNVHPGQTHSATLHFPIGLHGDEVYLSCTLPNDSSCQEGCWVTIDGFFPCIGC